MDFKAGNKPKRQGPRESEVERLEVGIEEEKADKDK